MIVPAANIRSVSILGFLCGFIVFSGCGEQQASLSPSIPDTVPYLTAKEFSERITNTQTPLLVEFSVPTGCARCEQMRAQLAQVATDAEGKVDVYRLDLNFERNLVSQLGITMCPTYVAFNQGKEVFRIAYPTSGDMLAAKLQEMTSTQ